VTRLILFSNNIGTKRIRPHHKRRNWGSQYEGFQTKLEQEFGKRIPDGYELVGIRRLGKSIVRFVYVQKYEKAIYPFAFNFYKPKEEWKLNGLAMGEGAADDLKASNVAEPVK
jgi:hypothetical protein